MTIASSNLTRRLEDYLEAVSVLVGRDGVARVRDIAARTEVSKSSVTAALRHLSASRLVRYDPYQLVTLTPRGEELGQQIRRKHETLRQFLVNVLNIEPGKAEANACRMEHVVDDEVLQRVSLLAEFAQERQPDSGDWLDRFLTYCRRRESSDTDAR